MSTQTPRPSERRSFLGRFHAGAAALAALALGTAAKAQNKPASAGFTPARHSQDDWMDELPGKHRLVFDTTQPDAFREALLFASNYLLANRNEYGLQDQDSGIIVIARHISTGYAYNDEMWAKYGSSLSGQASAEPPKANPTARTLAALANQGVHFAVCSMATTRLASMIARSAGMNPEEALGLLKANLVTNARLVPAGIVAVNRAQERGYTLVTV